MSPPFCDFHVGPLTFRIDGATGMLRQLRCGGHEVVRGIYPAVRDTAWATLLPTTTPMRTNEGSSSTRITLQGRVASGGAELDWTAEIEASASGALTYHWRARAGCSFQTNRTGLCVLHPAEVAGRRSTIEHPDGSRTTGHFPSSISPQQPFTNIRAITHSIAPGVEACVRMEGDIFEMEDQRNWTDASFKTYCRPLDWPRPYLVERGQQIEHTVTVVLTGTPPSLTPPFGHRLVEGGKKRIPLPRIGFGLGGPLPPELRDRARRLQPAHVRVDTSARQLDATLRWACAEAEALGCTLELAIRDASPDAPPPDSLPAGNSVYLFNADGNTTDPACIATWRARGHERVGTGTLNHFTELNRFRPLEDGAHSLTTFGMNAQVHAFDDTSMLETVTQHAVVTRQAHIIGGSQPVSVGPIILGPAPETADPRLHSSFAAVWTLASLTQLTRASAAHATYFRLHGSGGFLRAENVTPLEQLFLTLAGATHGEPISVEFAGGDDGTDSPLHPLLIPYDRGRRLLIAHTGEAPLDVVVPFSGLARVLGSLHPEPFNAGAVRLNPRSVWQLDLSA